MAKVKLRMRSITKNRKSLLLDYAPPLKNLALQLINRVIKNIHFEHLKSV